MRILMVPHAYLPNLGGVERTVQQLARFLRADGHEVGVLTDVHPEAPAQEMMEGTLVWRVPFVRWSRSNAVRFWANWVPARRRIGSIVREFQPDVVHMHILSCAAPYAQLAARLSGNPLVLTTQGSHRRDLNASGLAHERRLCRQAVAITHCSRSALAQFALKHPEMRAKSVVVYNGIAPEDFASLPAEPTTGSYALYAGRLDSRKGVDTLLHAWAMAQPEDTSLLIAGDGPERSSLERLAREKRLDSVRFLGTLPYNRVIPLMKAAAVLVLPTLEEGFPLSILEAMAASCPIVATSVGGIPEQIADSVHGLLVPPGDHEALASAMERVLIDREFARSLGVRALERVASEFHWTQIVKQYIAIYEGCGRARE